MLLSRQDEHAIMLALFWLQAVWHKWYAYGYSCVIAYVSLLTCANELVEKNGRGIHYMVLYQIRRLYLLYVGVV